jgi:hypothetical protein
MTETHWGSDVPVSLPAPVKKPEPFERRVSMGGFVFTEDGLFHDLDQSMHDELSLPTFAPAPANEVVYEDDDLDGLEYT